MANLQVGARIGARPDLIPTQDGTEFVTKKEMSDTILGNFIMPAFTFTTEAARDAYFNFPGNQPSSGTLIFVTSIREFQVYQGLGPYNPNNWLSTNPVEITGLALKVVPTTPVAPFDVNVIYVIEDIQAWAAATDDATLKIQYSFNRVINDDSGSVLTRAVIIRGSDPSQDEPYIGLCATTMPNAQSISSAQFPGFASSTLEATPDYAYLSSRDVDGNSTGLTVDIDGATIWNNLPDNSRAQTVAFPVNGPSTINGHRIVTEDMLTTISTDVQVFPYDDANWSGTLNAFEAALNEDVSIVSFWGDFTELAVVPTGQSTMILDPAIYPLLQRFVGQVDQWAMGYNNNTGDFARMPIRITATNGLEIVAPPNVAIGTNFSFQFMLVLANTGAK
jgi:hypothetical protein